MKLPLWKVLTYGLLAMALIFLYYTKRELGMLAFAPAGMIIYLIESYSSLGMIFRWGRISQRERWSSILSWLTLAIILTVVVLVALLLSESMGWTSNT